MGYEEPWPYNNGGAVDEEHLLTKPMGSFSEQEGNNVYVQDIPVRPLSAFLWSRSFSESSQPGKKRAMGGIAS